jgi:HK97 family phage portal protein
MDVPIPNNPNYTPFDFKHRLVSSLLLDGNAFILVLRSPDGVVVETRVLDPQKVECVRGEMGEPLYKITTQEGSSTLGAENIVHIPLFATGEHMRGMSPIEHHRVTLGLASASQLFGAKFYEQGATVGGVVKVPGELTADQAENLRAGFARRHEGVDRAWRVAVLTGGADYSQMSVKISDLQLVETLHWGVESIGRIYGVPLQYLQYPGGNTSYASAEVLGQAWLVLGLAPMLARIEAGLQRLIVGETTFIKFNTAGLLRATQRERMDAYAVALQNGILTLDEVRTYEDLPRLAVGGDQHWKPLNIGVVGEEPQP